MKQLKFFVCLLVFFISLIKLHSQEKFFFDADYTVFRYDNTKSLLEVYLAVYQNSIKYKFENNQFTGNVIIELSVAESISGIKLIDNKYKLPVSVNDTSEGKLKQKEISQLPAFIIENPGDYNLVVKAYDELNPAKGDKWEFSFYVPIFDLTAVKMSGIQLATSINKSEGKDNNFVKYGLEVMPNPNQFFGNNVNPMYYYLEIYGLKSNLQDKELFLYEKITDVSGNLIYSLSSKLNHDYDLMYQTGKFNIDSLESGTYFLKIIMLDENNNEITSGEKKFFIYNVARINENEVTEENTYLRSEYVTMTEEQINNEFDRAVYIRTDDETKNFKSLQSLDTKRKFMYEFWKKRDKTPNTLQNEFKIDYMKRILEANRRFKQSFKEGWKTDRGRIFMVYGEPNDIEYYEYQPDTRGYQIWHYETIEGGTICVFAEANFDGSGIYELVHSTIRGELRHDNWQTYIKK